MYVLVAITIGDDLIGSQKLLIECSEDRAALERLKGYRSSFREKWIAEHQQLAALAGGCIIDHDEIEEVPCL